MTAERCELGEPMALRVSVFFVPFTSVLKAACWAYTPQKQAG